MSWRRLVPLVAGTNRDDKTRLRAPPHGPPPHLLAVVSVVEPVDPDVVLARVGDAARLCSTLALPLWAGPDGHSVWNDRLDFFEALCEPPLVARLLASSFLLSPLPALATSWPTRHSLLPPLLDRLATHILAFEGDGYVHWCEGNYETYERQRRERLGINPDEPRRFRYKKLV